MTSKIASKVLKASSIQQMGFCKVIVDGKLFSVKEALDTAIEALEQEPYDDAISRPAVLSYISNDLGFGDEENGYDLDRKIAQEEIYNFVKKMPSIIPTPKEKAGKWIDDYKNEIDDEHECSKHFYRCSECGKYADQFVDGIEDLWDIEKPNFCPNCGCQMK